MIHILRDFNCMMIVLPLLLCDSSVTCEWSIPDTFVSIADVAYIAYILWILNKRDFLIFVELMKDFCIQKDCFNNKQSPFLCTSDA